MMIFGLGESSSSFSAINIYIICTNTNITIFHWSFCEELRRAREVMIYGFCQSLGFHYNKWPLFPNIIMMLRMMLFRI